MKKEVKENLKGVREKKMFWLKVGKEETEMGKNKNREARNLNGSHRAKKHGYKVFCWTSVKIMKEDPLKILFPIGAMRTLAKIVRINTFRTMEIN